MSKARILSLLIVTSILPLPVLAADAVLKLPDARSNFFSGSSISVPVEVHVGQTDSTQLSWSLYVAGVSVARREIALDIAAEGVSRHAINLELPTTHRGIPIEVLLHLRLIDSRGNVVTEIESPLYVLDPAPFQHRRQWLENLDIHLYDPEGTTVAVFEEGGIPFKQIMNPAAFHSAMGGILIIGEGLSLRDSRGLMDAVFKAVGSGIPAIVLSPTEGDIQLPGLGAGAKNDQPPSISLEGREVIRRFDKRLDSVSWVAGRDCVLRYFQVAAYRNRPEAVVGENPGWAWIALDWQDGARARLCGFAIMRDWDMSPTPRYLFLAILEDITKHEGSKR